MIRAFFAAIVISIILPGFAQDATAQQQPNETNTVSASLLESASLRLLPLIKGDLRPEDYFTDSFLKVVPASQFRLLSESLTRPHGPPVAIQLNTRKADTTAIYNLTFERADAEAELTVDPRSGRVSGLFIRSVRKRGDSVEKIETDFAALPGDAGFAVVQLTGGQVPTLIAGRKTTRQFAVASTFKLYILAELSAQIVRGERAWQDVTQLSRRSFSSPATRNWPKDSPATLETLALQMIAMSDNSASDTLLFLLGRNIVEERLKLIGHSDRARMLPLLATTEAFALKGNSALRRRYLSAIEAEQYAILSRNRDALDFDSIDPYVFASPAPKHIGTLEWFASPDDIARLLNAIRAAQNPRMLQILSTNVGPAQSRRDQWNYLGYKGGSEPGVISMSYLMQAKDGRWFALTGSWNNPRRDVDQDRFAALMMRLMDQLTQK